MKLHEKIDYINQLQIEIDVLKNKMIDEYKKSDFINGDIHYNILVKKEKEFDKLKNYLDKHKK